MTRETSGSHGVDASYMAYQYAGADKLRIRYETHANYSERTTDTFASWLLPHLEARAGDRVLDVGCGPGSYHAALAALGTQIASIDASLGMIAEATAAAANGGYAIDAAVASAESLPFAGASFDRLMANHMLYHVPDQPRALAEMRRVLRPGGRVMLATNGGRNATYDLHCEAARAVGLTPSPDASRFSLDDIDLVRGAFPSAEMYVREDALVFTEPAPFLRYYASYAIDEIENRPADNSHHQPLLEWLDRHVSEIIAREGALRLPKTAGCFVAER